MRVYDWIAPAGTTLAGIVANAEAALGVKLRGDTGEAHGYVNASRRPDGAVYVAVHLYDAECANPDCDKGEGAIALRKAPDVTLKLPALKVAVGEHPTHKLGGKDDAATLKALGFATAEEKLAARGSKHVRALDAASARCDECGTVAFTDGPLRS